MNIVERLNKLKNDGIKNKLLQIDVLFENECIIISHL